MMLLMIVVLLAPNLLVESIDGLSLLVEAESWFGTVLVSSYMVPDGLLYREVEIHPETLRFLTSRRVHDLRHEADNTKTEQGDHGTY